MPPPCPEPTPTTRPMTGSEVVLQALVEQGVEVVFGYPGGAVLPIYDAIFKQDKIRHILVRHEQGAVHAAEGYARSTGRVGVVLVTSGPGATNTVTGLTDALMDSVPVVCLTGQVPTHMIGNDAFQEADTVGITRPCTKHNYLVKSGDAVARTVHEAFHVARSGRPGPVVIDLPKDILMGPATYVGADQVRHRTYNPRVEPQPEPIARAVELMAKAHRPIFYVGGGVINSGIEASDAGHRARARDRLPDHADPDGARRLSGLGPAVHRHARHARHLRGQPRDARLRSDDRDRRALRRPGDRPPRQVLAGLAEDPDRHRSELDQQERAGRRRDRRRCRPARSGPCSTAWRAKGNQADPARLDPWWDKIREWQAKDSLRFRQSGKVIKPQYAIQRLYELTKDRETYITTEVGQHQMWAAQHYKFERPRHWMTSGGLGTMGYGLPSAMGVQVAHPDALVIDIAGEASWVMNMQEMSTIVQYRLPVKSFILNNSYMGMVRQWQEFFHGNRYSESYMDSLPDFVKLAEAFGAVGLRAQSPDEVDDVIKAMIESPKPVICDIVVDRAENVYPMIPGGAAHNEIKLCPEDDGAGDVERSEEGMVLV